MTTGSAISQATPLWTAKTGDLLANALVVFPATPLYSAVVRDTLV